MGDSELKEAVWETARGIAYFLVGYANEKSPVYSTGMSTWAK